jgi:NAD(P)-dependent dehydrogenase (short-subunit alcohol dehydrogenase family)
MDSAFLLKNRTIFITGASSGIGKEIAIQCSGSDANLIINGRDKARLQVTYEELKGTNHFQVPGDVSVEVELDSICRQLPPLDGVVLCAAIFKTLPVKFGNRKHIEEIFDTNTFANFLIIQKLLKENKIRKGASIVFISSVASGRPYKGNSLYSATKGAIKSFSKVLAMELASKNIRVNCISPGIVLTRPLEDSGAITKEEMQTEENSIPLGFGTSIDIAYGTVYLLSNASRWITGTDLVIDGGQSLK